MNMSDLHPVLVEDVHLDMPVLLLTARLLESETYGYVIMVCDGDSETYEAFILPEMIQNLIPVYLPMLRGGQQ